MRVSTMCLARAEKNMRRSRRVFEQEENDLQHIMVKEEDRESSVQLRVSHEQAHEEPEVECIVKLE